MATRLKSDSDLIRTFLSAYENGSWSNAQLEDPDLIERNKPAVDQLAIRKSDRRTLAVEHTIIQPFVGEIEDLTFFERAFLKIENDESLLIPGRWVKVFIPAGTLRGQRKVETRDAIVNSVHAWLKVNRLLLREGRWKHHFTATNISGKPPVAITLTINVTALRSGRAAEVGRLNLYRQQTASNLHQVIKTALEKKLPKLANTKADKRLLLLERQHMILSAYEMLETIEAQRNSFPYLACVDEIWVVETPFHEAMTYLRYEHYEHGRNIRSLDFIDGTLVNKTEGEMSVDI